MIERVILSQRQQDRAIGLSVCCRSVTFPARRVSLTAPACGAARRRTGRYRRNIPHALPHLDRELDIRQDVLAGLASRGRRPAARCERRSDLAVKPAVLEKVAFAPDPLPFVLFVATSGERQLVPSGVNANSGHLRPDLLRLASMPQMCRNRIAILIRGFITGSQDGDEQGEDDALRASAINRRCRWPVGRHGRHGRDSRRRQRSAGEDERRLHRTRPDRRHQGDRRNGRDQRKCRWLQHRCGGALRPDGRERRP